MEKKIEKTKGCLLNALTHLDLLSPDDEMHLKEAIKNVETAKSVLKDYQQLSRLTRKTK